MTFRCLVHRCRALPPLPLDSECPAVSRFPGVFQHTATESAAHSRLIRAPRSLALRRCHHAPHMVTQLRLGFRPCNPVHMCYMSPNPGAATLGGREAQQHHLLSPFQTKRHLHYLSWAAMHFGICWVMKDSNSDLRESLN